MPILRRLLLRRMGPLGAVLTAYDIWRRLPAKRRKQLLQAARTHGPRVASGAMKRRGRRAVKR